MPNKIKYNVSSQTLALKKGNFWIGTGDVAKGPTSTTGYWNGITPTFGGYTIYLNKANNGPSIYVASNDAQLIDLTNKIAGTSYSTANECLTYYAGQSDKMVFNVDYPPIVTDGLIMNLDAGFTPSYPRTGSTFYDNSPNGYNTTIYNSPSWNSNGWFTFDGTDDFIETSQTFQFAKNGQFSVCGLINVQDHSFRAEAAAGIIGKGHYYSNSWDIWLYNNESVFFETSGDNSPSNVQYLSSGPLTVGRWYFFAATYNDTSKNLWINNSQYSNTYTGAGGFTNGNTVLIARRSGDAYRSLIGSGSRFSIYSRELKSSEILHNYYQGLITTNGLVLALDGANIVSYPRSGTDWYDMSGNNYVVNNCNFQGSKNGYHSLWSNGNDADIASSAILDNDYHTIEFLLMFKSSPSYPNGYTGGWEQFFGYYGSGSDRTPGVWRFPSARLIHWQYSPGYNGPNFGKNAANEEFDLNKYYSVIVTKDGGTVKTYINGGLTNTVGASFPKTPGSSIVRFYDYYAADLMEIQVCRIYNRALTQDEVRVNYNSVINRI